MVQPTVQSLVCVLMHMFQKYNPYLIMVRLYFNQTERSCLQNSNIVLGIVQQLDSGGP